MGRGRVNDLWVGREVFYGAGWFGERGLFSVYTRVFSFAAAILLLIDGLMEKLTG